MEGDISSSGERIPLIVSRRQTSRSSDEDSIFRKLSLRSIRDYFLYYLSITRWPLTYQKEWVINDLMSGLTIGIMVIPQAVAYAGLAGLPPEWGLNTAFITPLVYFLFGSSRDMIIGPTTVMSLLVAPVNNTDLLPFVTLLTGFWCALLGLLRIGYFIQLISHAIVVAFTSGAALMIIVQQFNSLCDLKGLPSESELYGVLRQFIENAHKTNFWSLGISLISLATLLFFTYVVCARFPRLKIIPMPLVVVIVATIVSWRLELPHTQGVSVVGVVRKGLPQILLPDFEAAYDDLKAVIISSLLLSAVGFVEAFSIARTFAARSNQQVNADRELFALGAADMVAAFFTSMPASGSFSRTAVNANLNGRSLLSSAIGAVLVMFALLFLTPLLYWVPKGTLAAIIVASVMSLFGLDQWYYYWSTDKSEFVAMLVTFFAMQISGIEVGLMFGVAVSVLLLLRKSMLGRVSMVTSDTAGSSTGTPSASMQHIQVPITEVATGSNSPISSSEQQTILTWHNVHELERLWQQTDESPLSPSIQYEAGVTSGGLHPCTSLSFRVDDSLTFLNADHLLEVTERIVRKQKEQHQANRLVVLLDFSRCNFADATGIDVIRKISLLLTTLTKMQRELHLEQQSDAQGTLLSQAIRKAQFEAVLVLCAMNGDVQTLFDRASKTYSIPWGTNETDLCTTLAQMLTRSTLPNVLIAPTFERARLAVMNVV